MGDLTEKKLEPVMQALRKMRLNGRARMGMQDLTLVLMRAGIIEGYKRKNSVKYLESMGYIKIDLESGLIILTDPALKKDGGVEE